MAMTLYSSAQRRNPLLISSDFDVRKMNISQTSEFSKQLGLEDCFCATVLEASLNQFIHQFELMGCCLLWFCFQQQKPYAIGYCGRPARGDFLPDVLKLAIGWQEVSMAALFEVVSIENATFAESYQLYGCLCHSTSESGFYLLGWHSGPLADHQQYGMSLYTQALTQHLSTGLSGCNHQTLNNILQRSRHQLRTPLSLMQLYVDLLQSTIGDQQSQEWLGHLQTTVEEMNISLDHLTDLDALTNSNFEDYDLRILLGRCIIVL
jgi:hypothetical protein